MTKFAKVPTLKIELEQFDEMERTYEKLFSSDEKAAQESKRKCFDRIRKSRDQCIDEYTSLMNELRAIEQDNPEVYEMIYWHDIKGLSWESTSSKVLKDLRPYYGYDYCRSKVYKYLKRRDQNQADEEE